MPFVSARRAGRTAIPLACLLLSACATVPRLGAAPSVSSPEAFAADRSLASSSAGSSAGRDASSDGAAWPQQGWWRAYGDPQLDALISEALAGSPDVAVAVARVRQADAYAEQAGASRLPSLDASGNIGGEKQSYNDGIPAAFVPHGWNDTGQVAANLGFDLDLWGRNKASYAAARSDAAAARLDLAEAKLTLSTSIADAYADLARLFAERAIQENALANRRQTERLATDRFASGLDTEDELKQAEADVPAARADLAATDEQIALTRNRLAALLGKGPDRGLEIAAPGVVVAPRGLPADVTTDLIGRRPDVMAARARVEAAASRIKVARADFYPSIGLSAVLGYESFGLANLFKSGSSYGNAGPAISLPLFRGGELQGRYRNARAGYDEAVANYNSVVTGAYRQVADAVVGRRALGTRLAESQQTLADAEAAWRIARERYAGGLSRFLDVLTAEDRALQAEKTVTDLRARAFTLDVALVRALGGGFSAPAALTADQPQKDQNHG